MENGPYHGLPSYNTDDMDMLYHNKLWKYNFLTFCIFLCMEYFEMYFIIKNRFKTDDKSNW